MHFLIILAAVFIFFHPIILGQNFLWEDFPFGYFPYKISVFERLANGELPLWNPNIFAGQPIIADPAVGIFYPLNAGLIPFIQADNLEWNFFLLEILTIAHLCLAGIFMFALVRSLKLSWHSAIFGGFIFSLLGFWLVHLKHVGMIFSGVWLPLIFLYYKKFLTKG